MPRVTVVAVAVAKEGREKELESTLLELIAPTRKEKGFVQYDLHRDVRNPGAFVFYEIWESREDLDRHSQADHLARYRQKGVDLIERKELFILEQIG